MPAHDQRASQIRYLAKPGNYEKHKIAVKNRVARNMEKLPDLFDECDQCGSFDGLRVYYYTDTGRMVNTTMVSKVHGGWSMNRIESFIRDNHLLCQSCSDEIRVQRSKDRPHRAKNA